MTTLDTNQRQPSSVVINLMPDKQTNSFDDAFLNRNAQVHGTD
jgi:hypothetical protein